MWITPNCATFGIFEQPLAFAITDRVTGAPALQQRWHGVARQPAGDQEPGARGGPKSSGHPNDRKITPALAPTALAQISSV